MDIRDLFLSGGPERVGSMSPHDWLAVATESLERLGRELGRDLRMEPRYEGGGLVDEEPGFCVSFREVTDVPVVERYRVRLRGILGAEVVARAPRIRAVVFVYFGNVRLALEGASECMELELGPGPDGLVGWRLVGWTDGFTKDEYADFQTFDAPPRTAPRMEGARTADEQRLDELRAIARALAGRLRQSLIDDAMAYVGFGEVALAIETLCDHLGDQEVTLRDEEVDRLEALALAARADTKRASCLRVPASARRLLPLAKRWAAGDDREREQRVERASVEELQALVDEVSPRRVELMEWLGGPPAARVPPTREPIELSILLEVVEWAERRLHPPGPRH